MILQVRNIRRHILNMSLEYQGAQTTERRPDVDVGWFHELEKYEWSRL
jgi:hypothetical protein